MKKKLKMKSRHGCFQLFKAGETGCANIACACWDERTLHSPEALNSGISKITYQTWFLFNVLKGRNSWYSALLFPSNNVIFFLITMTTYWSIRLAVHKECIWKRFSNDELSSDASVSIECLFRWIFTVKHA